MSGKGGKAVAEALLSRALSKMIVCPRSLAAVVSCCWAGKESSQGSKPSHVCIDVNLIDRNDGGLPGLVMMMAMTVLPRRGVAVNDGVFHSSNS